MSASPRMSRRAVTAFHLDHNIARDLVLALRLLGHDAVTARDLGLERADDDLHLTAATDAGRIFVTYNRNDFIALHRVWQRWSRRWGASERHGGILILSQNRPLSVAEEARVLDELVVAQAVTGELYEYLKPPAARWRRELVP